MSLKILSIEDPYAVHYSTFVGDVYTLDTASITLTAGTLTANTITSSNFDINGGTVDGITSLTVANNVDIGNYTLTANTITDGTLSISGGDISSCGNISGTDIDLELGTGDLTMGSATVNAGDFYMKDGAVADDPTFSITMVSGAPHIGLVGSTYIYYDALTMHNYAVQVKTTSAQALLVTNYENSKTVFYVTTTDGAEAVYIGHPVTLKLSSGSITDSSGAIDFGDETLTTTNTITGATLTDGQMISSGGEITGVISIAGAAATFTGTVQAEQITSTDDITMQGHLLSLGDVSAATDTVINFLGSTNSGSITYDESADEFDLGDAHLTTTGRVGIGATYSNFAGLNVINTHTGINSSYGMNSQLNLEPGAVSGQSHYGSTGNAYLQGSDNVTGSLIGFYGVAGINDVSNNPTLSNAVGVQGRIWNLSTSGTITAGKGFEVLDASNAATITTLYGVYINAQTKGGTNWQIYSLAGDSYHAGKIALGQTDKAEYISSEADGFVDVGAGTNIRLNQIVDFNYSSGASTKNPENDSEDEWLEIEMEGTTYYIPLYAAS